MTCPCSLTCFGGRQARAQSQLLGQLLPMVAQLPSAHARCQALARIWAAAVASDLETRRAVRTRQKTLPGAELKQLLSDAFVKDVVSGTAEGVRACAPVPKPCHQPHTCESLRCCCIPHGCAAGRAEVWAGASILRLTGAAGRICAGAKDTTAPDAQYPAFREELVCALLETLISHPRAEAASRAAAVPDEQHESTIADAMQALSIQQTPPATPGECCFPATTALTVPCAHPHAYHPYGNHKPRSSTACLILTSMESWLEPR